MEPTGPRTRPGFSLIELLVAIAVIALLIGVLMPALSKSRGSVIDAHCRSNLRQVALAQHAYAMDHGVFSRLWPDQHGDGEAGSSPVSPLQGYLSITANNLPEFDSVMQCPSADPSEFDRVRPLVAPGQQASSYGINGAMHFTHWRFNPEAPKSSRLILLSEQPVEPYERAVSSDGYTVRPWAGDTAIWTVAPNHDATRGYRHKTHSANQALIDGSVARLDDESLRWDSGYWYWWDSSSDVILSGGNAENEEACGCPD